jgi:hypothetical protein
MNGSSEWIFFFRCCKQRKNGVVKTFHYSVDIQKPSEPPAAAGADDKQQQHYDDVSAIISSWKTEKMMRSLNLGRRPKYQKLLLELVLSFSQKSQLMMKERGRERTVWNHTPTSRKCGIRVRRIRVVPCDIPPSFDYTHQQKKTANKERENKITKQRASGNTHILSASHAQTLDLLNWVCCCCLIRSAESFRG